METQPITEKTNLVTGQIILWKDKSWTVQGRVIRPNGVEVVNVVGVDGEKNYLTPYELFNNAEELIEKE